MHEILTASGNFLPNFSMQHTKSQCKRHISIFTNFSMQHVIFLCTFPNITCNQSLVIVIIYSFHGFFKQLGREFVASAVKFSMGILQKYSMLQANFVKFFHARSLSLLCSSKYLPCMHSCNIQNVHSSSTRVTKPKK